MTDVRTQRVIEVLTDLGFEKQQANRSHALYTHKTGASVSIPYRHDTISPSHLNAIERQVSGFGVAPSHVFGQKIRGEEIVRERVHRLMRRSPLPPDEVLQKKPRLESAYKDYTGVVADKDGNK